MIQRIQTFYLFLAAMALAFLFLVPIYTFEKNVAGARVEAKISIQGYSEKMPNTVDFTLVEQTQARMMMTAAIALFLLFTIFQYGNRKRQVAIARVMVIAEFALIVFLLSGLQDQINAPEIENVKMGIGVALPSLAIIFTALAARSIRKDEEMVKAADRLR